MQDSPTSSEDPPDYEARSPRFSPFNFLAGFGFGAFIGVGLALIAIAMVDTTEPARTATLEPDEPAVIGGTVQPTPDLRSRTTSAQDVRLGPGNGYAIVGLLARDEPVEVVGRDSTSEWVAIRFPPGSAGRGWIPVGALDTPPDLAALAIAIPTPLPRTLSTFAVGGAFNGSGGEAQAEAEGDVTVTRTPNPLATTPQPNPGPGDLVVQAVRLLPDRRVSVTVANRGPGDISGFTIFVQVRNLTTHTEMLTAPVQSLRAGATVTVQTATFLVEGEETVQAIVDPLGGVPEVDKTNNLMQVVLAAQPTLTPTSSDPAVLPVG